MYQARGAFRVFLGKELSIYDVITVKVPPGEPF
jgi:hypothetical protein